MIYYLILAHNKLDQLELLVKKLKTSNSEIYIHIDKKINKFKKLKNVHYINDRKYVFWWWTSMIKAELSGFKEIAKHMKKWDHIVLISWQCYPIKPIKYIEKYIWNLWNKSCMSYKPGNEQTIWRISRYYFNDIDFHIPKKINQSIIDFVSIFKKISKENKIPALNLACESITNFFLPRRKYLRENYKIFVWSQWMVLSYSHIEWILEFCKTKEGKKFLHHFKMTSCSDEIFFQTILLNHKEREIENNCLWYIERDDGAYSPNILKISDLQNLKKSDKLFARKFDISVDEKIVEELSKL